MKKYISKPVLFVIALSIAVLPLLAPSPTLAADAGNANPASPQRDMREAQRDLEAAARDFPNANPAGSSQKTGRINWSDLPAAAAPQPSGTKTPAANPSPATLQGSPETGYAGTWTDPATGDIVTSVIAPRRQQPSYQSTMPIIVEPDISSWGYSGNQGWQGGYGPQQGQSWPQWPNNPGEPGYPGPGNPPSQYPGPMPMRPMNPMAPMGPSYAHPSLPPGYQPGYRPLRPQPHPGQGNPGGIWNPNMPAWPSEPGGKPQTPEFNIPDWKPFPPANNQWAPNAPEYNIPGWKPFPPSNNQFRPPRPGFGAPGMMGPRGHF